MKLPTKVTYPIIAIGDLHGQLTKFDRLLSKLCQLPVYPRATIVLLGDLVDRGESPRRLIDRVLQLIHAKPSTTCVMGNHDYALVRALGLDGPASEFWMYAYATKYNAFDTLASYDATTLTELRKNMPASHRDLLRSLPWIVESERHLFLHNGLTPEVAATAEQQVACARVRCWDRGILAPRPYTATYDKWTDEYPVWLGADKGCSAKPLPHPTKVQVTGHARVDRPDVSAERIRIDTTGGSYGELTACVLPAANSSPIFVASGEYSTLATAPPAPRA